MINTICFDELSCTACSACYNICRKNAINMLPNSEGFIYPSIDYSLCVSCGLCQKICPQNNNIKHPNSLYAYGAINLNSNIVISSSSGGVFRSAAKYVLEQNGIVAGCSWTDKLHASHVLIDTENDLEKLSKSKYIQSEIGNIYFQIKCELDKNRLVLFSGTPCQVDGLKAFLQKEYHNLICVDIVCHGVPNQQYFDDYISFLEKKHKKNILEYDFRFKGDHEGRYARILFQNRYKAYNFEEDFFYRQYMNGEISRESCYRCKYANLQRVGDLSLGDLWGADCFEKKDITKGASLVLINSDKGISFFNYIKSEFNIKEISFDSAIFRNAQLKRPAERPDSRDFILKNWKTNGISSVYKLDFKYNKKIIMKRKIIDRIPNCFRKTLRKLVSRK